MNPIPYSLLIGIHEGRIYFYDFKDNQLTNLFLKGESSLRWKEEDPSSVPQLFEGILDYYRVHSCESIQVLFLHSDLRPVQLLPWLNLFQGARGFQIVEIPHLLINYALYLRWLTKKEPIVNVRLEQQTYKLMKEKLHYRYRTIPASSQYELPLLQLFKYSTTLLGEKI